MYRYESGIIHKSQKNFVRANLIANFVGDNRVDNHFDCKFIYRPIADWEVWNLIETFRKPSGKYRYNGNQYTYDELCNLLQEEFIRVELVAKIIEESEKDERD